MQLPSLTVLMSVHNGAAFLSESIQSILDQTWTDFEFIIIDDGSTDETPEILATFASREPRIRIMRHEHRAGLTKRLNHGLQLARGDLVARMDADDIALPERLALQQAFLNANPEVAAVGGAVAYVDESGTICGEYEYPITADAIREMLLYYGSPIAHAAAMFRREVVLREGGYREVFPYAQDYDLWLRLAEKHGLANIPETVLKYRRHGASTNVRHALTQLACMAMARFSSRQRMLGMKDPLKDRREPVDAALAMSHLRDFDIVTLGQFVCADADSERTEESSAFTWACWRELLHRVPTQDREKRSLAVAYTHALKYHPNELQELSVEWQASPYSALHSATVRELMLALPMPPLDKLERALNGCIVEDELLARELVWQLHRGDAAPDWLIAVVREGLSTSCGTADIEFDWLSSRYGCLSLLLREGLTRWMGKMLPQADISHAGPTASLGLLCRMGAALHPGTAAETPTVGIVDLGRWLLAESRVPQGRDLGLLRRLAQLGMESEHAEVFTVAADLLAASDPAEEEGVSVIVSASAHTAWLNYLSDILAYTTNAELILCDLSDNFAVHFCESDYAHKHRIKVIASSRGVFAPKNEALALCRYPCIAFAKDNFCYSYNVLPVAMEHLRDVDAIWGHPFFAPEPPEDVQHNLVVGALPPQHEELFPLFIRRSAVEQLGFFLNLEEEASETEYRTRLQESGLSLAYADDVLVPHGISPTQDTPPPPPPPPPSLRERVRNKLMRGLTRLKHGCRTDAERSDTEGAATTDAEVSDTEGVATTDASSVAAVQAGEEANTVATPAAFMPALREFRFESFEEWLQLLPAYDGPVFVSPGMDLSLRRAGLGGALPYTVLTQKTLPATKRNGLLVLFAQEARSWPRSFLAAHCTVLVYDGQVDDCYADRAMAYEVADLCVAMTEELRDRLALLHPAVCLTETAIVALAVAKKLYWAWEHGAQYEAPLLQFPKGDFDVPDESQVPRSRIMLVVDTFYTGGRENVILALMPFLRDKGYSVVLGVSRAMTPAGKALLEEAGLEYLDLTADSKRQQALMQQYGVHLVAAQHCRDGVLAATRAGIPCVQTIYGMFLQAGTAELDAWKEIDAGTTAYICVSALSAMCVDRYFGVDVNKVAIIPCASSMSLPTEYGPREQDEALRAELSIPLHSPVFMYPARLQDAKGQRLLLDAFALAHREDPRVRLVLLGPCFDHGYKRRLQELIAAYHLDDAVILAGHRDDLPRFFNLARALVMPSFTEGWSLAIAEAVQVGLPVIATDVGGATEQLRGTGGVVLPAFATDLWNMTPARFERAMQREHQHHQLRDALCDAFLDLAARSADSVEPRQTKNILTIEEACARQLQVFLAVLAQKPVAVLRAGTFHPQKQSRYFKE